ncbi:MULTISPECIES: RDD family protein [unclassified Streptomyces]|uniref:RDD family protein n=1 Tax=Streptomyces TaxID=1883 RepID=UPI0029588C3C|nr:MULTISPECIES: RDD family protein [unclassified Streptomyces]MDV9199383.1 RDD family protein [Streptomyces sp. Wh19]
MTISRGTGRTRNLPGAPLPTPRPALPPAPGYRAAPHAARVPPRAGDMRRYLAVGLDCYLCLVTVGLLARPYVDTAGVTEAAGLLLGPALAFSFLNHVVLTALTGAGAGKLIMGIRVVRLPDAGRPGPWLLLLRWLYGLGWLPLQPWYGLRTLLSGPGALPRTSLWNGGNGELHADPLGLRLVRHSDLTAHRTAVAAAAPTHH